jgi:hypothetical protein
MSELAIVEQQGIDVGRWAETLVFAAQLAEKVHDTEFVPKALRGRPEAVAATIMYGAEVGVTPMQALSGIHIVEGRPSPSAELMRAMILRAGHSFTIHEMSGTRVRISGLRRGRPEGERVVVDWSLDMARAAGLLGKSNWRNYPRAMLTARAFGDLARVLFPDVVKGLGYVAEDVSAAELDSWRDDGTGDSAGVGSDAPRKPLQRRQRRRAPEPVDEPSGPQHATAELPPVAPPLNTPDNPPGAASPERVAGEDEGEAPSPAAPVPTEPELTQAELDAERAEQLRELPPEVVADTLAEVRAETLRRHKYADADEPELPPENDLHSAPQPEQTPPEPPAPGAPRTIADGPLRAMHAGLTRELGTVATREEKHALVAAILGKPIESTKNLTRAEGYAVLDMLSRFADGLASWQLDIGSGAITVVDNREPPEQEGGPDAEQQP